MESGEQRPETAGENRKTSITFPISLPFTFGSFPGSVDEKEMTETRRSKSLAERSFQLHTRPKQRLFSSTDGENFDSPLAHF